MSEENEMVVRPAWKAWAALALAFALGLCVAFLVMRSQNANKPQVTAAAPAVPAVEADPAAADPAAAEPLDIAATFPSWDLASPALAELTAFVADVCDPASPNYREPADRIATFDMDGTIISEKAPYYIDYAMPNYAEANGGMGCFVVCDDVEREYGDMAYAQEGYDLVAKEQWTAFSMAEDWATIYGENVVKTELPGAEAEELADAA